MSAAAEPTWSDAQLDAIESTGQNLLVSAAAGSGKTSVLAARCVNLVCHPDPSVRCDIDQLLVVTFTRAAAAEMRSRIEKRLRERAEKTNDPRLRRQLRLIDRAEISTLHSFCTNVLRRHFSVLDLDPGFTTLEDSEALLLRNEVAKQLFERKYAGDTTGQFQELIQTHFGGSDQSLRTRVLSLRHQFLCSLVNPAKWCADMIERLHDAARSPLGQSQLGCEFIGMLRDHLAAALSRAEALLPKVARMSPKRGEFLLKWKDAIEHWTIVLQNRGYDAMVDENQRFVPGKLPWRELTEEERNLTKSMCDLVTKPLRTGSWFKKALAFTSAEWQSGLAATVEPAQRFLDLVNEFTQAYTAAKRELRGIDFADMEMLTLRALRTDDTSPIRPGPAAVAYREQFKYVLVDEYQDINPLQDQLLRFVSRDEAKPGDASPPNFFCVGDVKQSIYRFRLADPSQFIRRSDNYATGDGGRLIALSENYRSDPPVLATVNQIFRRLMTRAAAEIDYDDTQTLKPGKKPGDYAPLADPVEFHLLPEPPGVLSATDKREYDSIDREAAIAAELILRHTAPDASPRFTFGDFAILLRTVKVKGDKFAAVLRRCGVPVHADSSSGLFDTTEIRDMLSLLRCLDNPQQDVPLASLLRSPMVQLESPDDSLARIRIAYPAIPFHLAVGRYAVEKSDELARRLGAFSKRLEKWREQANLRPVASVLWQILEESGYLAYCSALPDGRQRVANLLFFHDRARQFGEFHKQGLRRFLEFFTSLEDESDLGLPSAVGDPGNVVRIMSIHRSKGLEFPIVVVPDLGKKFNRQDVGGTMIVDRVAGVCPSVVDLPRRARWDSLAAVVAKRTMLRQMSAEELRVLYVATTRAKRKLILTATTDDPAESIETWNTYWAGHRGAFPADDVLAANSMLDWLGPAAAAIGSVDPTAIVTHTYDEAAVERAIERAEHYTAKTEPNARVLRLQPLPNSSPPTPAAAEAIEALRWTNPFAAYANVAAARAITQLTKSGRSVEGGESPSVRKIVKFTPPLPLPKFLEPGRAPSPTEAGTATHRVLQAIDFAGAATEAGVLGQIAHLLARRSITKEESRAVDAAAIAWFMATDLGRLLRDNAATAYRELPVFAPARPEFPAENAPPPSADPRDRIMLRGQLDVLVRTPGGLVVIDYKTDRITEQTLPERTEFYRPQVRAYCDAIALITGEPVVASHLVFLAIRRTVTL